MWERQQNRPAPHTGKQRDENIAQANGQKDSEQRRKETEPTPDTSEIHRPFDCPVPDANPIADDIDFATRGQIGLETQNALPHPVRLPIPAVSTEFDSIEQQASRIVGIDLSVGASSRDQDSSCRSIRQQGPGDFNPETDSR